MRRLLKSCVITVVVLMTSQVVVAADPGPDPRIKELKVLDQLAGSWTGTQPGTKRKVRTQSEWILKGRVLQTKSLLTDGREMLILRTYDTSLRTYIVTVWDSRGMAVIVSGDYDPQTKTLTAAADAGRTRFTVTSRMTDENTEEWQVLFADPNGKPLRQFGGINRRDKP